MKIDMFFSLIHEDGGSNNYFDNVYILSFNQLDSTSHKILLNIIVSPFHPLGVQIV